MDNNILKEEPKQKPKSIDIDLKKINVLLELTKLLLENDGKVHYSDYGMVNDIIEYFENLFSGLDQFEDE